MGYDLTEVSEMTSSMCVSMTGRPTMAQILNEQRRRSYPYLPKRKEKSDVSFEEILREKRGERK